MRARQLTEREVREIKGLLLRGTSSVAVARAYQVNPETVGRIKRGATHQGVRVQGEERLRPEVVLVGRERAQATLVGAETEEEIERAAEESLREFERVMGLERGVVGIVGEVERMMEERG